MSYLYYMLNNNPYYGLNCFLCISFYQNKCVTELILSFLPCFIFPCVSVSHTGVHLQAECADAAEGAAHA